MLRTLASTLLNRGYAIKMPVSGRSMNPTLVDGDVLTIVPIQPEQVRARDIVLANGRSGWVAHRVVSLPEGRPDRKQFIVRGDAACSDDRLAEERIDPEQLLGLVISVERDGRSTNLRSRWELWGYRFRLISSRLNQLEHSFVGRLRRRLLGP